LYLPEYEDFGGRARGHQVERNVFFSVDPRDTGWIKDNIPCQWACPALTKVPGYIRTIFEERYGRSCIYAPLKRPYHAYEDFAAPVER
jgi:hypothetical protein